MASWNQIFASGLKDIFTVPQAPPSKASKQENGSAARDSTDTKAPEKYVQDWVVKGMSGAFEGFGGAVEGRIQQAEQKASEETQRAKTELTEHFTAAFEKQQSQIDELKHELKHTVEAQKRQSTAGSHSRVPPNRAIRFQ